MKILIVEDDFYSRKYLKDLLELEKFTCKTAENGQDGLKLNDEFKPDLIITDIQMPYMNGLEMVDLIREKQSDTIVIMTTAFGSEDLAIQALRLGANNYLKKPISDTELLPLLRKYESIIKNRSLKDTLPGKILRREVSFEFDTSIEIIPMIVERLIREVPSLDINDRTNIELGLIELITNAIEHGNLAITSKEKKDALENNTIQQLYNDRMVDPVFSSRKLFVEFKKDESSFQWIISDEGMGFDILSVPNPTIDGNLLELGGRGIFISRFLFDELEYMGSGNIVRVKKNIKTS
jgi:CheY-like chemotaxis protein/anti-sigma regulatory factor (Ser/Thr protein kinase)